MAALWGQYELLRPARIEAIRAVAPVAYLPWGALEWHSYHNPIGLDCLVAHGMAKALAAEVGGVVLPPVYIGTETIKPFKGFPHTIDFSADQVKAIAGQFLRQLADEKFRVIVLLTGHLAGAHTHALSQVVEEFAREHPDVAALFLTSYQLLEPRFGPNHAAWGETSLQLHFDASLVDLAELPADREATLDDDGVWGIDPRKATASDGAEQVAMFVAAAAPKVRELLMAAKS